MAPRLSEDAVRKARVRAQRLDGAAPVSAVAETVSAVVGIQAQDETAAALSIRARSRGLVVGDVQAALTAERSVVLTWSLRGTRHYHHHADVRWLVGLFGPVFGRPGRRAEQLGIGGEAGRRALRVVRDALGTDGPLTRRDIAERLASHGVDPCGQAPVHVLRRAALEGILCIVPDPAGKERYVLLDDWVPPTPRTVVGRDQAAAELARRYLAAYGPARPADLATWSGLGVRIAKEAWSAIAPELTELETPAGPAWAPTGSKPADAPVGPVPVRLLGGFDALLLGYADRSLHVAPEHSRRVNAGGGLIKPTVLADGRVIGTWAYRRDRSHRVQVDPFRPLTPEERAGVEREATEIGRFLGTDPALTVVGG